MFANWVKMGLLLCAWVKNRLHEVETQWLSGNEKVLSSVVRKKGHGDSVLGYEKTHHYWFLWKRCNCKKCFLLPISHEIFILFIEWGFWVCGYTWMI